MRSTRTRLAAFVIALTLVAGACGSDDGGDAGVGAGGPAATGASATDPPVALEGEVHDEGTVDVSDDGADAAVDVEVDDDYFKPTFIQAAPGATVTVELENEGDRTHTFTLDDGSVDETLEPGARASVTVTIPSSGSLRFACDFHGGNGMQGAFFTGSGGPASDDGSATTDAPVTTDGSPTTDAPAAGGGGAGGY